MNDEHGTPPPEDHDDQSEPRPVPKSPEERQEALKAIHNDDDTVDVGEETAEQPPTPTIESGEDILKAGEDLRDSVSQGQPLPRSEIELRLIVREIVKEVLKDVESVRRAVAEPVEIVTIPQFMIPRLRMTPKRIAAALGTLAVLIGAPVTWATWPRTVEIPDGAVGLWTTVSPRYADRAFRITKNTLTFHLSPQDSTFHSIVRVRETEYREEQGTTKYTLFYTHYRDEHEFSFLFREEPNTTIRLFNQKQMKWRKSSS